jgi:hypothetical protein
MSATDHEVATEFVQPDAPAAAPGPRSGPAATFATREHFNLQTARAVTVSEANRRPSIYLAPFDGAPSTWQLTLTAAGMVAVVNDVDRAAIVVPYPQPAGSAEG